MVSNIGRGSYTEKLEKLNLTTLEERRWRGDMIQTWRILSGKDRVNPSTWFDMEGDRCRVGATTTRHATGHHAIKPRPYKHVDRGHFFSNRVVQEYNDLRDYVKMATNINSFKNCLDKYRGTPNRTNSRPTSDRLTNSSVIRGTS